MHCANFEIPRIYFDRYFQLFDSVNNLLRMYPLAPFPKDVQFMALLWSKHGPYMVLLFGHNIDMSLGLISFSPESFISLLCLES